MSFKIFGFEFGKPSTVQTTKKLNATTNNNFNNYNYAYNNYSQPMFSIQQKPNIDTFISTTKVNTIKSESTPKKEKTSESKHKFSWGNALKNLGKGFKDAAVSTVKAIKEHPAEAIAIAALATAAIIAAPAVVGIAITAAFVGVGAGKMLYGAGKAAVDASKGNNEQAEKDFQIIGSGGFDVASSVVPGAIGKSSKFLAATKVGKIVSESEKVEKLVKTTSKIANTIKENPFMTKVANAVEAKGFGNLTSKLNKATYTSQQAEDAVAGYQKLDYAMINTALRHNKIDILDSEMQDTVKILDSIQKPIEEATTAYRKVYTSNKFKCDWKVGDTFEEKGFSSTSIDTNNPLNKTLRKNYDGQEFTYQINIPKNSKVIKAGEYNKQEMMSEIILPRNSKFKVTGFDEATKTYKLDLINF